MNTISIRQNEKNQIQRLAAQRELYNAAKRYQAWETWLSVFVPITFALGSLLLPEVKPYSALYGLIFVLLDSLFFERNIKKKKSDAAKIQELFDCDILELEKSPLKSADDVTVELVLIKYHAHQKTAKNIEKLKDWYPKAVDILPIHLARLVCQRTNCYWDSRLRRRYANSVLGLGGVLIAILLFVQIALNRSFVEVILFLNTLLPVMKYCIKQHLDQHDSANRLDKLVGFAKSIWATCDSKSPDEVKELSRRLQDEIYDHRTKSALISNNIYNLFRSRDEKIMNETADALIDDAKERKYF